MLDLDAIDLRPYWDGTPPTGTSGLTVGLERYVSRSRAAIAFSTASSTVSASAVM